MSYFTNTIQYNISEPIQYIRANTIYQSIYMEFLKMVTMTLYARQQKRHRYKEQTFGLLGRRQQWGDLRE